MIRSVSSLPNHPYFGLMLYLRRNGITQNDIANLLNDSLSAVNDKINRRYGRDFTLSEALAIEDHFRINDHNF